MRDRAGFIAGCADALTELCAYYIVAGLFIMARRGWGLHLGWLLLGTVLCSLLFALLLQKPRTTGFLTAVGAILFAALMALFIFASSTPMRFGYVLVLAVGAGMAMGCPLNYALHRPQIHQHLTRLDVVIVMLALLILCREALGLDGGTVALVAAVLFLDAAAAVGLRMSEDGDGENGHAFRAVLVALGGALGLAGVIGLLLVIFSRSGEAVGKLLRGLGRFFSALGGLFEAFFLWFSGLISPRRDFGELPLEPTVTVGSVAELEAGMDMNVDPVAVAVILGILLAAALTVLLLVTRNKRFVRSVRTVGGGETAPLRRRTSGFALWWQRLRQTLAFEWTALCRRNSPAGLLVWLERQGRREHRPRRPEETMRCFIDRMAPEGTLSPLAEALDMEYYGGETAGLSPAQCRRLRRSYTKAKGA